MPLVVVKENRPPKSRPVIYTVTVMKRNMAGSQERSRTWGWYSQREHAERDVLANATDMFEANYYDIALIEEYPEGILTLAVKRWWYRATYVEGEYSPLVKRMRSPKWAKGTINFAMG